MIRVEYRQPDAADLEVARLASRAIGSNLAFALVVFGGLSAIVYAVSKSLVVAIISGGGLFALSLISNLRFFAKARSRNRLIMDPKAVEVISVEAARVVEIQPIGTGVAYVFFAERGEAILVSGQWQLEYRPFPVSSFQIFRWADTKEPIRIESNGTYILPEESDVIMRPDYTAGKVELFTAYPDTLQENLDAAFTVPSNRPTHES